MVAPPSSAKPVWISGLFDCFGGFILLVLWNFVLLTRGGSWLFLGLSCLSCVVSVTFKGKMHTPTFNAEFNFSRLHVDAIHGVEQ